MILAMIIPLIQWVSMQRHMHRKQREHGRTPSRRPWVRSTAPGAKKQSSRLELRDWSCASELEGCPWEFEGCDCIQDVLERIWCPLAAEELHEALELLKLHVQTVRVARVEVRRQDHDCFGIVYGVAGGHDFFGGAPLEHDVSLEFSHEAVFDSFNKDQRGLNVPDTRSRGLGGLWTSTTQRTRLSPPQSPRASSSFMARAFGSAASTPPRSPRGSSSRIASASSVARHLSEPWKARLEALLPRRGVQAIHELPLQSLSPFYRIHDGFASLSSTLDLPDLLERPDTTVAGSCFYIYPALGLKKASRYPTWVRFARVDRNCVACASRREKRSRKIAYIERNGDRILDDYSPLAFVGDTVSNMVSQKCCGVSKLYMQAGGSSSSGANADAKLNVPSALQAPPRAEQEVGPRTAPEGEEGVSASSSPVNSQSEEDLFESEGVPCPLAPSVPVFATGQPDLVLSVPLQRHAGIQDSPKPNPRPLPRQLARPMPTHQAASSAREEDHGQPATSSRSGPRHHQTQRPAPRPSDATHLPAIAMSGSEDEEWQPQHWSGSITPTRTEEPQHWDI